MAAMALANGRMTAGVAGEAGAEVPGRQSKGSIAISMENTFSGYMHSSLYAMNLGVRAEYLPR
jgi:hypothetical protein